VCEARRFAKAAAQRRWRNKESLSASRDTAYWYRRGRGACGQGRFPLRDVRSVESKRVDEFANMSDEELRQYVYGNKESDR
jgi:hypothetical protein